MTLQAEMMAPGEAGFADALGATLATVTRMKGTVELKPWGSLPNDGKVIDDKR